MHKMKILASTEKHLMHERSKIRWTALDHWQWHALNANGRLHEMTLWVGFLSIQGNEVDIRVFTPRIVASAGMFQLKMQLLVLDFYSSCSKKVLEMVYFGLQTLTCNKRAVRCMLKFR